MLYIGHFDFLKEDNSYHGYENPFLRLIKLLR